MSSISPRTLATLSRLATKTRGEGHTVELRPRPADGGRVVDNFYLVRGGQIISRLGATVTETRAALRD